MEKSSTILLQKGKRMRKTIQKYLSGFEIKPFTALSFGLCAATIAGSEYTPCENAISGDAFLRLKMALIYFSLVMFLIKTLLLRELAYVFDILTLFNILYELKT